MSIKDIICNTDCPIDNARVKHARRKEARPGELLDAALDLFVAKGFAATRAEEVAAKAGVSKGTLFLYFKSKEDLFEAVVRENPDQANQYRAGKEQVLGFLVGQIMKRSGGRAEPKRVRELVRETIASG